MAADDGDEQEWQAWHDRKSAFREASLGKEHDMVMHAVRPSLSSGGWR